MEYVQKAVLEHNPMTGESMIPSFMEGIIKFMYAPKSTFDTESNESLWNTKWFDKIRGNDAYEVYPELEQLKAFEIPIR